MGLLRRDAKRDASERDIVDYLTRCGVMVVRLSQKGLPDLLCGYGGRLFLLECKTGKEGLTEDQAAFFEKAKTKGLPVYLVRTPDGAAEIIARIARL